jgi:periplasmic divalent cation tolerance protein
VDELSSYVIALTTWPVGHDVDAFATTLVSEGLAACVNVLPGMRSVYRWKGAVERAEEAQILLKTTAARIEDLERRIRELHPYDVPEFLVVPIVAGSEAYLNWVADSTKDA